MISRNDIQRIKPIVIGGDINVISQLTNDDKQIAFLLSVLTNTSHVFKYLIDIVNIHDVVDNAGRHTLMYASLLGHTELAKLIIEKDPTLVHATDNMGRNSLICASNDEVIELLLQQDIKVNEEDMLKHLINRLDDKYNSVYYFMKKDPTFVDRNYLKIEQLISYACIYAQIKKFTYCFNAIKSKLTQEILDYLLYITCRSHDDELHPDVLDKMNIDIDKRRLSIVKSLVKAGANVNSTLDTDAQFAVKSYIDLYLYTYNKYSLSSNLVNAIRKDDITLVKFLIESKADTSPNITDNNIINAAAKHSPTILKYLIHNLKIEPTDGNKKYAVVQRELDRRNLFIFLCNSQQLEHPLYDKNIITYELVHYLL